MNKISWLKSFLFFILLMSTASADTTTSRQKFDQFLQGLDTYQAKFTQLMLDQEDNAQYRSTGTFFMSRPGHFLWRYETPENLYILADGKSVWLVDEGLEQVTQRSQRSALQGTPAMLLASDVDIDEEFISNDLGTHLGMSWLELIPRNEESQFEQILLAFEEAELVRLEMLDKFGQTTRFEFSQSQRNQPIDRMTFVFQPPPGYDILQQDE